MAISRYCLEDVTRGVRRRVASLETSEIHGTSYPFVNGTRITFCLLPRHLRCREREGEMERSVGRAMQQQPTMFVGNPILAWPARSVTA